MNFDDLTLSQSVLAKILDVPKSNLHKRIADSKIQAVDPTGSRKRYNISDCRKICYSYLSKTQYNIKNKINLFYNFKGGTGKTTLCFQVASMLSLLTRVMD